MSNSYTYIHSTRSGKILVTEVRSPSGEPGSGKSTQLRSILTTLIKYLSPDQLHFYLGDLKLSEFHLFKGIKHVKGIAIFPEELKRMLAYVYKEMLERGKLLNTYGVMHVNDLPKDKKVPLHYACH